MLPELVAQLRLHEPIAGVRADGAYDTWDCLDVIAQRGAQAVIATRKNASICKRASPGSASRNEAVLDRFLEAGHSTLGGMASEKYCKLTGTSKATATRDLADLAAKGLLRIEGVGKATRYVIAIDLWIQAAA